MTTLKLIDKASLNTLAIGINKIINDRIKIETDRAKASEGTLQGSINAIPTTTIVQNANAIAAINDADSGILTQSKQYAENQASTVQTNLNLVSSKVNTNTTDISSIKEVNISQSNKITSLETKIGIEKSDLVEPTGIYKKINDLQTSLGNIDMSGAINTAKSYTDQKITDLVNGADSALDTLKELGDALGNSENALSALTTTVSNKANLIHTHEVANINGLSTVASSGSYSDLSNKPTLSSFEYTHPQYTDMHTLEDAINQLLYVSPVVSTLTASPNGGTFEIGAIISSPITFSWTINKTITSQSLTDCTISNATLRTVQYTGSNISANKTFTLTVSDGKNSSNRSITYTFQHRKYWGVSTLPGTYNSAFIKSLTSSEFSTTKAKSSFNIISGTGQYIFYCFPTAWGTPTFNVGGFKGGFEKIATIDFTNASGNTTSFDIWKSENSNLGTQSIIVE